MTYLDLIPLSQGRGLIRSKLRQLKNLPSRESNSQKRMNRLAKLKSDSSDRTVLIRNSVSAHLKISPSEPLLMFEQVLPFKSHYYTYVAPPCQCLRMPLWK